MTKEMGSFSDNNGLQKIGLLSSDKRKKIINKTTNQQTKKKRRKRTDELLFQYIMVG